jgi:hypothetical protein
MAKMKKQIYTAWAFLLIISSGASAQGFIKPVDFPWSRDCRLTLNNGEQLRGVIQTAVFSGGSVRSFTVKLDQGEVQKYKAEDVKKLMIRFGDLAKIETIMESTTSIQELVETDFNEIIEREYLIYEQALLPKKKDKFALLQLLNPGFDGRIKVYENPTGQETGTMSVGDVTVTGGRESSYLVVKDGKKSMKVKKGKYKKAFPVLFGDCEEMMKMYRGQKVKFENMAYHVLHYEVVCK